MRWIRVVLVLLFLGFVREVTWLSRQQAWQEEGELYEALLLENEQDYLQLHKHVLTLRSTLAMHRRSSDRVLQRNDLQNYKEFSADIHDVMRDQAELLQTAPILRRVVEPISKQASIKVLNRLKQLQNPEICQDSRFLVGFWTTSGFGAQLHYLTYGFNLALSLQRIFVLHQADAWEWAPKDHWQGVLQELSHCPIDFSTIVLEKFDPAHPLSDAQFLKLDKTTFEPQLMTSPPAMPADVFEEVSIFHNNPGLWWVGHLVAYLLRPQPSLQREIDRRRESWTESMVGIHVRRTDKISVDNPWHRAEAQYHNLTEYMDGVERWFDSVDSRRQQLTGKLTKSPRHVYVATDTPQVLDELTLNYPNYQFQFDLSAAQLAEDVNTRRSDKSLAAAILDIIFLSHTQFLVCTLSSTLCRVSYELQQTRIYPDGTDRVLSLDDAYLYDLGQPDRLKVFTPHFRPISDDHTHPFQETTLQVGDTIRVKERADDWLWTGFSERTGKNIRFPCYKVKASPFLHFDRYIPCYRFFKENQIENCPITGEPTDLPSETKKEQPRKPIFNYY
eukprot:Lithocolla_globosa_v1_NODE_2960_length_1812_cov_3.919750.p1 type:complete len:559 gc:universal NODE_2960_length_1812_cov_3.919750:78-1754(+)